MLPSSPVVERGHDLVVGEVPADAAGEQHPGLSLAGDLVAAGSSCGGVCGATAAAGSRSRGGPGWQVAALAHRNAAQAASAQRHPSTGGVVPGHYLGPHTNQAAATNTETKKERRKNLMLAHLLTLCLIHHQFESPGEQSAVTSDMKTNKNPSSFKTVKPTLSVKLNQDGTVAATCRRSRLAPPFILGFCYCACSSCHSLLYKA